MPYLTPDSIPEDDICRPLLIPDDTLWLAIVSGALTELTKDWNWQQEGAVTVDEAVARMQLMVDQYYDDTCGSCAQPDGQPIATLDEFGAWRMLEGGAWVTPTGGYALPPAAVREEPTEYEKRCAAAANAVNVLKETYEEVADLAADEITLAEFVIGVGIALGLLFAPPLAGLAAATMGLGIAIVEAVFDTAQFVTADNWTSEFDARLQCILLDNATVGEDGRVYFNFSQVRNDILNAQLWQFDPTLGAVNLALQLGFILGWIGEEGLNIAGGTTAIEDPDCADCTAWCVRFGDGHSWQDWAAAAWNNSGCDTLPTLVGGDWVANLAYATAGCTGNVVRYVHLRWVLPYAITLTDVAAVGAPSPANRAIYINGTGAIFTGEAIWSGGGGYVGGEKIANSIDVLFYRNVNDTSAFSLDWVQLSGVFEHPFGESNC